MPQQQGLIEPGNIDLSKQPSVYNPETGGQSSVWSAGIEDNGQHVLVTRVTPDGKILSVPQAIQYYRTTGQHLGKFTSDAAADAYSEYLHNNWTRLSRGNKMADNYGPSSQYANPPAPQPPQLAGPGPAGAPPTDLVESRPEENPSIPIPGPRTSVNVSDKMPAPTVTVPAHVAAGIADHASKWQAVKHLATSVFGDNGQPPKPGQLFRNILFGALAGGAAASEAHARNPQMGGFEGAMIGGQASVEDQRKRAQLIQAQQQQQFENQQKLKQGEREEERLGLEKQRLENEKLQFQANSEHFNREMILRSAEFNNQSQEQLYEHNKDSFLMEKWANENGAKLAPFPDNGQPGNAKSLMNWVTEHPKDAIPPAGMTRVLTTHVDTNGLTHDPEKGWVDSKGNPVDLDDRTTASAYFVPITAKDKPFQVSGADLMRMLPHKLGPGSVDPKAMYTVDLDKLFSLKSQDLQNEREDRQQKRQEFMMAYQTTTEKIKGLNDELTEVEKESKDAIGEEQTAKNAEAAALRGQIKDANDLLDNMVGELEPHYGAAIKKQRKAVADAAKAAAEKGIPLDQIQAKVDWTTVNPESETIVANKTTGAWKKIPISQVNEAKKQNGIEVPRPVGNEYQYKPGLIERLGKGLGNVINE